RILLSSSWRPGEPVWQGTIDGAPVAVQVRPILNGFRLFHRGIEAKTFVYTESESAATRLMPAKVAADTSKKLLCPMPGLVVSIAGTVGHEGKAGETLSIPAARKKENRRRRPRGGGPQAGSPRSAGTRARDATDTAYQWR